MDDLVSRKAAIRNICGEQCECEPEECSYGVYGCECVQLLNKQPTVEAVSLEPLCVWLAAYAAPPKYAMDHVYDMNILNGPSERYEAWKYHFRELLKSGLMDTEDEDAKNK